MAEGRERLATTVQPASLIYIKVLIGVCLSVCLSLHDRLKNYWANQDENFNPHFYDPEIVLGKMKNLKKIQNAIIISVFLNNLLTLLANTFCNVKSVCNAIG